jgi:hypothetical protein
MIVCAETEVVPSSAAASADARIFMLVSLGLQ